MKKSALQKARAAYQPKLPIVLTGAVKAVAGEPTNSVADQDDIKALFPNTYGLPELKFEKATQTAPSKPMNVGVILSGGQAPGGHNVICGLFDGIKKVHRDSKLYGFLMVLTSSARVVRNSRPKSSSTRASRFCASSTSRLS